MQNNKLFPKLFGVTFILSFLSYGIGASLIDELTLSVEVVRLVIENSTQLIIGVILVGLIHTVTNIMLPVLLVPILKKTNKFIAYGYLCFSVTATIIMTVRSLFSLLILPISQFITDNNITESYDLLIYTMNQGAFYSYHLSMALWGIGGLMLVHLIHESRIVPRFFAGWGFIGYLVFITGSILEMFGFKYSLIMNIPGGLFELSLCLWLLVKGINTERINYKKEL